MDAKQWDERYAGTDLVWTDNPNVFVAEILDDVAPGTAVDLAAGEGRHAVWLARRGWDVTAVDFSSVGLVSAQRWADEVGSGERLTTVVSDIADFVPAPDSIDLLLLAYVQVPAATRRQAIQQGSTGVRVGGRVVVVAHDSSNLAEGTGGPPDPRVLYTPEDVVADLTGTQYDWEFERQEVALREVAGAERPARDAVVVARRVG